MRYCAECRATIDGERCRRHPDEPILDPAIPEVAAWIERHEAGFARRAELRWAMLGGAVGFLVLAGMAAQIVFQTPLAGLARLAWGLGYAGSLLVAAWVFLPTVEWGRSGLNDTEAWLVAREETRSWTQGPMAVLIVAWPMFLGVVAGEAWARRLERRQ